MKNYSFRKNKVYRPRIEDDTPYEGPMGGIPRNIKSKSQKRKRKRQRRTLKKQFRK